uniref:Bm14271 n=1 Tax=Brugia malayi TaxID=6279 RepID=A0A1I9G4H0_BRUMA|nr:Bm14271 [Brugia malayi]
MSRIYSFNYNIILAENAVVQRRHAIILALFDEV